MYILPISSTTKANFEQVDKDKTTILNVQFEWIRHFNSRSGGWTMKKVHETLEKNGYVPNKSEGMIDYINFSGTIEEVKKEYVKIKNILGMVHKNMVLRTGIN